MQLKKTFLTLLSISFFQLINAEPPYPVMKSCQTGSPLNNSITMTSLNSTGAFSQTKEKGCLNSYEVRYKDKVFGSLYCKSAMYLTFSGKRLSTKNAVERTSDPEVHPGTFHGNVSDWWKIDDGQSSYLCISSPLSQSGHSATLSIYYVVEGAFDDKTPLTAYFYYFGNKDSASSDK